MSGASFDVVFQRASPGGPVRNNRAARLKPIPVHISFGNTNSVPTPKPRRGELEESHEKALAGPCPHGPSYSQSLGAIILVVVVCDVMEGARSPGFGQVLIGVLGVTGSFGGTAWLENRPGFICWRPWLVWHP